MALEAHDPKDSQPENARQSESKVAQPAPLQLLTSSELSLLQSITLSHAQGAVAPTAMILFSRAWFLLEQERRRRKVEIQVLERLYFGR